MDSPSGESPHAVSELVNNFNIGASRLLLRLKLQLETSSDIPASDMVDALAQYYTGRIIIHIISSISTIIECHCMLVGMYAILLLIYITQRALDCHSQI